MGKDLKNLGEKFHKVWPRTKGAVAQKAERPEVTDGRTTLVIEDLRS